MDRSAWQDLTIERHATPPRLSNEQFRAWMSGRQIFVSSVMDSEMNPDRLVIRDWLRFWDAVPVMWEEITPRDERSVHAYLDGVDRSQIFLLLLGSSYGVSDEEGASPTYREGERAVERGLPRLLFLRADVRDADRDPKLTRWIRSLYNEVSAARYTDGEELMRALEQQLREIASAQETPWIKLGSIVFPGALRRRTISGEAQFIMTAHVRDRSVRGALAGLSDWRGGATADRLTSGYETWPVEIAETEIDSQQLSSDEIIITCRRDQRRNDTGAMGFGGVRWTEQSGRTVGPTEQAKLWADQALFGAPRPARHGFGLEHLTSPDGPTAPEILAREQARGWLAEGLVRLYVVEGLVRKFGGRFERLEVGPATASGIRVATIFQPHGFDQLPATIEGIVSLGR